MNKHGKTRLVNDLVMMGYSDGFCHSNRFNRQSVKALSPYEQPGYFLKKFMEHNPERAPMIKDLKASDFNHRQPGE